MSFFKKWNNKKSHPPSGKTSDKANGGSSPFNSQNFTEEDLPPSIRRPDRNLSISRSGRHKMKQRQRASVMTDELYSPTSGQPRQQPQSNHKAWSHDTNTNPSPSKPPSGNTGYHCRETVDSPSSHSNLSGSQRMAHAPTAV